MIRISLLCIAIVLSACATGPSGSAVGPDATPVADLTASVETPAVSAGAEAVEAEEIEAVEIEEVNAAEIESPMICERVKRPGSRVAEQVCYARGLYDEMMAQREAYAKQTLRQLDREQQMREISRRQAEEAQRRRMGVLGP